MNLWIALFSILSFASSEWVSVSAPAEVSAKPGAKAEAILTLTVKKGFHIQANPASKPNLIATEVKPLATTIVTWLTPSYPGAKMLEQQGVGELATYEGEVSIKIPFQVAFAATPGKHALEAKVRFQACDEKTCYFPQTETFSVPLSVQSSLTPN